VTDAAALAAGLAAALRGVLGPVTVEGLARMTGGAARGTWSFDAVGAGGTPAGPGPRPDPPGRPGRPRARGRAAPARPPPRAPGWPCPRCCSATTALSCGGRPGW